MAQFGECVLIESGFFGGTRVRVLMDKWAGPALLLDWMDGPDSVRSLIKSFKFKKGIFGVGESGFLIDWINRESIAWGWPDYQAALFVKDAAAAHLIASLSDDPDRLLDRARASWPSEWKLSWVKNGPLSAEAYLAGRGLRVPAPPKGYRVR
jgi:hypothetical protein